MSTMPISQNIHGHGTTQDFHGSYQTCSTCVGPCVSSMSELNSILLELRLNLYLLQSGFPCHAIAPVHGGSSHLETAEEPWLLGPIGYLLCKWVDMARHGAHLQSRHKHDRIHGMIQVTPSFTKTALAARTLTILQIARTSHLCPGAKSLGRLVVCLTYIYNI